MSRRILFVLRIVLWIVAGGMMMVAGVRLRQARDEYLGNNYPDTWGGLGAEAGVEMGIAIGCMLVEGRMRRRGVICPRCGGPMEEDCRGGSGFEVVEQRKEREGL